MKSGFARQPVNPLGLKERRRQTPHFTKLSGERLDSVRTESAASAKQLREEVVATLSGISATMAKTIKDLAAAEKLQLEAFSVQIASLTKISGDKLDGIRVESATSGKQLREEVIAALKGYQPRDSRGARLNHNRRSRDDEHADSCRRARNASIYRPSISPISLVKSLRTKAFLVQFEAVSNREKTVIRFTGLRNPHGYRASSHVVPPAL